MRVVNLTKVSQFPDTINSSGIKGGARISPKGRVDLPAGFVVDPNWEALHPNTVKSFTPTTVSTSNSKPPVKTNSSKPRTMAQSKTVTAPVPVPIPATVVATTASSAAQSSASATPTKTENA